MQWCVSKTGFEMFDALHAYGLGILLATAFRQPIELSEAALSYRLSGQAQTTPATSPALLEEALGLPQATDLASLYENGQGHLGPCYLLNVAVLDGLLTALFTLPGVRTLSVSDLLGHQYYSSDISAKSLAKVASAIARWQTFAERQAPRGGNWLSHVLQDYTCPRPVLPLPAEATRKEEIRLPLMIDPSFAYSLREPTSNGHLTHKINLTVRRTPFAAVLAFLGASRFLRAQRLARYLVNAYVPLASTLVLTRRTALPPLPHLHCPPGEAATRQWLGLFSQQRRFAAHWRGIAYQTLQTQKGQQSITLDRGYLDCVWLLQLPSRTRQSIVNDWRAHLGLPGRADQNAREHLAEVLMYRRVDSWMAHLSDLAHAATGPEKGRMRLYSIDEVRRLSAMMDASANHPLRVIVERQEGTLRFGRALRQLGEYKAAILRDVLELLETVQTPEQLILTLHRALQECELAKAKNPFIVIPDNMDCALLLDDVQQYGVRMIASLLILLSVLRNPRADKGEGEEPLAEERSDGADDLGPLAGSEPTTLETLAFVEEGELDHDN